MLSPTKRALEDFDNQHDFERMAADILNALGYADVEPMAPGGGPDGGRDIKFRDGDVEGIAFVTLEKKIAEKFRRDLAKMPDDEGCIAIFCNVGASPSLKVTLSKEAIAHGYTLQIYDLERQRSLLDGSLREIRRRYLGIDDEASEIIRKQLKKLLRFPDAIPDTGEGVGTLERSLIDQRPRRVFELLLDNDQGDVLEVPGVGHELVTLMTEYYQFRQTSGALETTLLDEIGKRSGPPPFLAAWQIHLAYCLARLGGSSAAQLAAGHNFLNYGIRWESAEQVFLAVFQNDARVSLLLTEWAETHKKICLAVQSLAARL